VGITCLAGLGFMANQVLRQRSADDATMASEAAAKRAVLSYEERARCEGVLENAKRFVSGSISDLARIEADLKGCGLTLTNVQR